MTISNLLFVDIWISFSLIFVCSAGCAQFYNSNSGNISSFNLLDKASTVPVFCVYMYMFISIASAWLGLGFFLPLDTEHWHNMSSVVKSLKMSADPCSDPLIEERKSKSKKKKKLRNFMFWRAGCSLWRIGGFFWTWEGLSGGPKRYVDKKIELYLIFTFWSSN